MDKDEILKKIEELKVQKEKTEQLVKLQDVFQHAYKIFLNSVYGFTGTPFSPVFNKDIAESVTLTGQAATKEMVRFTNACLNKIGKTSDEDEWVVAGDTDSVLASSKIQLNDKSISIENGFDLMKKNGYVNVLMNGTEVAVPNDHFETDSLNGRTNVKNISRHKVHKQMYTVKIPGYEDLGITQDHSVMIERDGKIIECKPGEIRDTDYFVVKCQE